MKKLLLNSKSIAIVLVVMSLFIANSINAQKTWDGGAGTSNWGDANNWAPNGVPAATDAVTLINNTTVNVNVAAVGASLTFPAGANNVTLNINSGFSLNITGTITIPRATGSSVNTLAVGAGTLTAGSLAFTSGGNAVRHIMTISTGTATISGNVTQTGSTGSASITFTGTGLLKLGGSFLTSGTGTLTQGTGTVEYNAAGAQTVGDFTYNNLTVSGSGAKTTTGVTISATGKLSMQGTATITAAPTYTAGATLEYAGSAAQTTTNTEFASGGPSNLIINNPNGVTLNANKTIATALTLTSGQLIIPTGITFTITSTSVIGGSPFTAANSIFTQVNTTSGARGIVRVNVPITTNRLVPVSDGTNYLPVTINASAANGYNITAFSGATTDATPQGAQFSAAAKKEIVDAVWNIGQVAGAGTTNLTLGWPVGLEGSTFALVNSIGNMGIAMNTGGTWGSPQQNTGVLHTSTTRNLITVAATSSFAVGKQYPAGGALPIKVNYFNAAKGNGYNTLNWSAESTSESATFDVERSADGKNFTAINTIAASRLDMLQPFNYVDNSNLTGSVYYRIKIIDFNGKVTYSSVVRIAAAVNDIKLVAVLPNPVSNTAQLNIVSTKKDNVQLSVVSMTGQLVQRSNVQLQSGSSIINLDVTNLQSGMYTIKGTFSDGTVSTLKFVKQ